MTATISALIPAVRAILDTASGDFTDVQLAPYVADGFRELWRTRPVSRYVDGVITEQDLPSDTATLLSTSVTFDERWRLGVIYFAAARANEEGINDSVHLQLAQTLKQQAAAVFAA